MQQEILQGPTLTRSYSRKGEQLYPVVLAVRFESNLRKFHSKAAKLLRMTITLDFVAGSKPELRVY
jgi:hypothetical protein